MAQPVDDSLSVLGCPPGLAVELTRALKAGQTTTAHTLIGCGVPYPTAIAIRDQVNARTGNASVLVNAGINPSLAVSMAAAITAGPA